MKSKHNPFRSTATRSAAIVFACFTVLHTNAHAATVNTTGTTVNYTAAQNILDTTWIGNGTLNFNGSGTIGLDNSGGGHPDFFNMTGGIITVQSGVTLRNGGWQGGVWTNNLASIAVAGAATLDLWDGNPVRVDALTGAGTVTISSALGVNWAGSHSLVLGVNGGGGTFTGNISGNSGSDGGSLSLTKVGTGTQTLTGANTYNGTTTVNAGTLELTYANSATGTLATGSNITVNSGGTLLANAFNALGYTNHGGDTLQVNEGGTLKVGAGQVVSMPYNLNVVGGSLTSADAGYPGLGTFYLGGGTQTFTS